MEKTTTACCALCQISNVNNDTPLAYLKQAMTILKKQKEENKEVGVSHGNGQTSVFVIVSPSEDNLKNNLESIGFKNKHTFERRKGYPAVGDLQMYIKNL